MGGNNKKETDEHPKTMIEVLGNTREAVEGYAATADIPFNDAALILVLNELRCIHWHFDQAMVKDNVPAK